MHQPNSAEGKLSPFGAKTLLDEPFALYRHLRTGSVNRSEHSYAFKGFTPSYVWPNV
jgi:hypothetical protein